MNKTDFLKIIDKIVEKKINQILPKMVKNEVKKQLRSGIQPDFDDYMKDDDLKLLIKNPSMKNNIIKDDSKKNQQQLEFKNYSKNEIINKILNDMAKNFVSPNKDLTDDDNIGSYKRLLESEYENIDNEFLFNTNNMNNLVNEQSSEIKPNSQNILEKLTANAKPEIVNAMIKDYSKMLRKVEKSAKLIRNGGLSLRSGIGENW